MAARGSKILRLGAAIVLLTRPGQDAAAQAPHAGVLVIHENLGEQAAAEIDRWLRQRPPRGGLSAVHHGVPAVPMPVLIFLTNGDRLPAAGCQLANDILGIQASSGRNEEPIRIPVEFVRGILFETGRASERGEQIGRLLEIQHFDHDVAILDGEDRLSGEVQSLSADRLTMESAAGPIEVAVARLRALAFSRTLWQTPEFASPRVAVSTDAGGLLMSPAAELRSDTLWMRLPGDVSFPLPLSGIQRLSLYGDDMLSLPSLSAVKVDVRHFLPGSPRDGVDRADSTIGLGGRNAAALPDPQSFQINRTVRGTPLTVGETTYPLGFGVTSGVSLRVGAPPQATRLLTTVALDDLAGNAGSVIFRVETERGEVWTSGVVRGGDPPMTANVDVHGAVHVTLSVDFADDGDVQDIADWCEPRFLLEGPRSENARE